MLSGFLSYQDPPLFQDRPHGPLKIIETPSYWLSSLARRLQALLICTLTYTPGKNVANMRAKVYRLSSNLHIFNLCNDACREDDAVWA